MVVALPDDSNMSSAIENRKLSSLALARRPWAYSQLGQTIDSTQSGKKYEFGRLHEEIHFMGVDRACFSPVNLVYINCYAIFDYCACNPGEILWQLILPITLIDEVLYGFKKLNIHHYYWFEGILI